MHHKQAVASLAIKQLFWDQEKMVMLQSEQQGGESSKDPYDEVMGKDKHKGHLRHHGSSMTKSKMQRTGKKSSYTLPEDLLYNVKVNLTREVAQDVASLVLSQIKAANPDISLVIPDFGVTPVKMVRKMEEFLLKLLQNIRKPGIRTLLRSGDVLNLSKAVLS
ncbi:uncharacterized protein [Spinacia oleracea]|uniref:Uncharacterized protein isoform X2 n=1 Tax=Spinacia oleracea TaxID=3562 RepID=A0A9R0HQT0_SPIOL|nr:uncharacterized protein LOC110774890 isoform X2 [Spinacia oleracea]